MSKVSSRSRSSNSSYSLPPRCYSIWQRLFTAQKLQPLLDNPSFRADLSLLELGCGPGTNRAFFRQREYCGVDLDPRAIEAARQAFPDKFVLGDITSIDLAESRFDLVLLHSVLHHLDDDSVRRAGNNLSRNLSDHGKVFIVDAYQAESVSISRLLTSLDRGRFIRPWPVWRDLVEEFLTVESSQFFSLWLGPLRAYRMFMVVGHPKGGG